MRDVVFKASLRLLLTLSVAQYGGQIDTHDFNVNESRVDLQDELAELNYFQHVLRILKL
jgi:hypothetical protein